MDTKVNNVPKEQHFNKATLGEAQCDESQNEDILEDLMTVWQQHSEHIEQIARHHNLSQIRLAPRPLVFSSRRRSVFSFVAMTLVCLATIVCMVILRRHFISDTIDLLFFLLLCLTLAFTAAQHLSRAYSIRRQSLLLEPHRYKPASPLRYSIPRAAVLASVVVFFLFIAVPVQSGRSMSYTSLSQRSAATTYVSFVLSHIK